MSGAGGDEQANQQEAHRQRTSEPIRAGVAVKFVEAIAAVIDQSTVARAAAVEDDDDSHRRSASQRQKD